jgi:hypothetical protein
MFSEIEGKAHHPRATVMYELIIGPITNPILPAVDQKYIVQTRSLALNMSSMLPRTTTVGIADRRPQTKRPTTTAASDGTAATRAQNIVYNPELPM